MVKRVIKTQQSGMRQSPKIKSKAGPFRLAAAKGTRALSADLYRTTGLTGVHDLKSKVESLWLNPGLFMLDTWDELDAAQRQQIISEFHQAIERQHNSESPTKWWASFCSENSTRPGIIERVIAELKVRDCSIHEFFVTYVYSGTDNIAANLFLVDMMRSKREKVSHAWIARNIVRARETLAAEAMKYYQLDCKASRLAINFLNEFCRRCRTWSDSDILALMWLIETDTPLTHLMYLSSIAECFSPYTMFWLLQALRADCQRSWSQNLHSLSLDVDRVEEWLTGEDVVAYSMHFEFFKKLDCPVTERTFDYGAGACFSSHFTEFSRPLIESILSRLIVKEPITPTLAEQISRSFAYLVEEAEIITRLTHSPVGGMRVAEISSVAD